MRYYKILNRSEFVGVITEKAFRKYQPGNKIIVTSDSGHGSYVYYKGEFYRSEWMIPVNTDKIKYTEVYILEITKDEYDAIKAAIDSEESVNEILQSQEESIHDEPKMEEEQQSLQEEQQETPKEPPEATLAFVRDSKIKEMRAMCGKVITDGFDITLSNEDSSCHFSLSIQDQLNLLTLSSQILEGTTEVIYHADNQVCKYYPANIATEIINMATQYKTYHTTYYNSLKVYIESMEDITEISKIEYGIDIPEEYQSDTLKSLLSIISDNNITEENIETEEETNNEEKSSLEEENNE